MRKQQYVTKSGEVHIYQNKWSEAKIEIALKASDLADDRFIIVPAKPIYYRPKTNARGLASTIMKLLIWLKVVVFICARLTI